jgi:hypothetical protein
MWRHSCDDDNPYCCDIDDCHVDLYRMKGKCRICRKADLERLNKEVKDHQQLRRTMHLEALGNRAKELLSLPPDPETSSEEIERLQILVKDVDRSAKLLEAQFKLLNEMDLEYGNMERIEDAKLQEQVHASLVVTGMLNTESRAEVKKAQRVLRDRRPSPPPEDTNDKAQQNTNTKAGESYDKFTTKLALSKTRIDSKEAQNRPVISDTEEFEQSAAKNPKIEETAANGREGNREVERRPKHDTNRSPRTKSSSSSSPRKRLSDGRKHIEPLSPLHFSQSAEAPRHRLARNRHPNARYPKSPKS